MFGISFEHFLIVGVILILLGPKRLPEIGNSVGKSIKNFKDAIGGMHEAETKLVNQTPVEPKLVEPKVSEVKPAEAPAAVATQNPIPKDPSDQKS